MPKVELLPYHKDLAGILKSEENPVFRKNFLDRERLTAEYKNAKEGAKRRNLALKEITRQNTVSVVDESSQEFPAIGNPLVDLKPAERELTPQEQTILWANQVLDQYNNLPKKTKPEIKKAKYFVFQTAKRLVQYPQDIEIAGSVWKSREPIRDDQEDPKDSFYETVKKQSASVINKDWEKVTPVQLAQLVKTYANSELIPDFAKDLLTNYFRGPKGMVHRVRSLHDFVYGIMDFATSDQNALKTGVKIARFESDILPNDSAFRVDMFVASQAVDDDEVLGKKMAIDTTVASLSKLADYHEDNINSFLTLPDFLKDQFSLRINTHSNRIIKKLSREEGLRRVSLLGDLYDRRILTASSDSERNEWPFYLMYTKENHLGRRFNEEIATWAALETFARKIEVIQGYDSGIKLLNISRPDGLIANIILPNGISEQRTNKIIRDALLMFISEEDHVFIKGEGARYLNKRILNEGVEISCLVARQNVIDKERHQLSYLNAVGFPNPTTEGEKEIGLVNIDLAEEIRRTQLRFLNKRGVRVPVENSTLGDFGYSHIDYQKDADDSSKTLVKIFVGDVPYSVKLDRYFNFDFEGKKFNAPFIQDGLRYTILSYLKPILCEETVKNAKGEEKDLDAEVVSRMGHLMLLPSDRHRSVQAIVNCFRIEGKDLIALDAERREMRRKAGNRVPEDREYTYRRPVIEKDENLPPITIHLPGVLKFRGG